MINDAVNIKGTKNGLVININSYYDMEIIKNCLQNKFESTKGFFSGAQFHLKPNGRKLTNKEKIELETLCKNHGLIPSKNKKNEENYNNQNTSKPDETVITNIGILPEELNGVNNFIKCNIRNGQKLFFKGNVILVGDINPGGQLSATGSIIIIGSLKGIAHSGVEGNDDSFIIAYDFCPYQIRIAQTIARNPERRPLSSKGPEIAFLEKGTIVIEKYKK
jgi:septum site-determining protein MinC